MSASGQKQTFRSPINVRITPESGHWLRVSGCPLSAKSGHMQRSKMPYSTTSSALYPAGDPARAEGETDVRQCG